MGQKVNPIGFRLAVRRDWKSRWYAKGREFSRMVIQDSEIRRYIEKHYAQAMISKVEIERVGAERNKKSVRLTIHTGRPGSLIGKKGEGIDKMRANMRKLLRQNDVVVEIREVKSPEADAKLVALNIAGQLENRTMFRRAMRRAFGGAERLKVDGIKIMLAGRLNGIEIARTEWHREGRIPLHTLKNDIDFGQAEARTEMGVVGVKVWISKGDISGYAAKKAKYTVDSGAAKPPAAKPATTATTAAAAASATATASAAPAAESTTPTAAEATPAPTEQQGDSNATTS